jgi:site-specific DNA-methyltransferase (cytosine-N4-specific)
VALPDFFIRLLTRPGDLVVDPFAGTCTTAVAAEQHGRRWLVAELDASYTTVLPERLADRALATRRPVRTSEGRPANAAGWRDGRVTAE